MGDRTIAVEGHEAVPVEPWGFLSDELQHDIGMMGVVVGALLSVRVFAGHMKAGRLLSIPVAVFGGGVLDAFRSALRARENPQMVAAAAVVDVAPGVAAAAPIAAAASLSVSSSSTAAIASGSSSFFDIEEDDGAV